jgi:hypothetical protein
MSGDGEVVFVSAPSVLAHAQRWTVPDGFVPLPSGPDLDGVPGRAYLGGFYPNGLGAADFQGIQAIGVGCDLYCFTGTGECNPVGVPDQVDFYWSADSGTGPLPSSAGYLRGAVLGASSDLRFKLIAAANNGVAMLVDDQAPLALPQLSTAGGVQAVISGDGSVVAAGTLVWYAAHSTRFITDVLTAAGLRFDGWSNLMVTGLDMRGLRFCGAGTDPSGATEAWFADTSCGSADFNCDGAVGTDADIEAFFACLSGDCPPPPCTQTADFNHDGAVGTDADIEAFFRVLGGGSC